MLYIMRHGKTEWNEKHKLQGRTDIPLNEKGILMAKKACEEYKDVHFDICYCSPLTRAKQTAELVLEGRNVQIIYDTRLEEMSFGKFEGTEECINIPDCPIKMFFLEPENYEAPEGAESLDDLFLRTGSFLNEVVMPELEKGKDILIVGHGAMNSSILCQVKNLPRKDFWRAGIENCKLMKLM